MQLDSNLKTIEELRKTFACTINDVLRIDMEGMRYKAFEKKYQRFISYCGASIIGAKIMDVVPKNPVIRILFSREAGEVTNVDKQVSTFKEVIFGTHNDLKV